jgi:hypothetical protein
MAGNKFMSGANFPNQLINDRLRLDVLMRAHY